METPLQMQPRQDAERALVTVGRVEVEPHGEHPLEKLHGRLDMLDIGLPCAPW